MNRLHCPLLLVSLSIYKEGLLYDGFVRSSFFQGKEVTEDRPPWKDYPELYSLANLQRQLARAQEFPYQG